MTPEEQRIAIAEACDGKCCYMDEEGNWMMSGAYNTRFEPLSDWNTRPEMLNALRKDEQLRLIQKAWWHYGPGFDVNDDKAIEEARELLLLNLSQPQFAESFLRAKGLWKD